MKIMKPHSSLLEIQREIVARIETERAVVYGTREVISLHEEKLMKVIERVWEM